MLQKFYAVDHFIDNIKDRTLKRRLKSVTSGVQSVFCALMDCVRLLPHSEMLFNEIKRYILISL